MPFWKHPFQFPTRSIKLGLLLYPSCSRSPKAGALYAPYLLGNLKHQKASWSIESMDIFAQKPKVLPVEVLAVGTGPEYVICQAVKSLSMGGTQITGRQLLERNAVLQGQPPHGCVCLYWPPQVRRTLWPGSHQELRNIWEDQKVRWKGKILTGGGERLFFHCQHRLPVVCGKSSINNWWKPISALSIKLKLASGGGKAMGLLDLLSGSGSFRCYRPDVRSQCLVAASHGDCLRRKWGISFLTRATPMLCECGTAAPEREECWC